MRLAVNVKAPFFLVQQALPLLRDDGRIVNISSGVTRIAYPHIMAYNITKGAVNTFTLHLCARSTQDHGECGSPGIVDTDVNAPWLHTPEGAMPQRCPRLAESVSLRILRMS